MIGSPVQFRTNVAAATTSIHSNSVEQTVTVLLLCAPQRVTLCESVVCMMSPPPLPHNSFRGAVALELLVRAATTACTVGSKCAPWFSPRTCCITCRDCCDARGAKAAHSLRDPPTHSLHHQERERMQTPRNVWASSVLLVHATRCVCHSSATTVCVCISLFASSRGLLHESVAVMTRRPSPRSCRCQAWRSCQNSQKPVPPACCVAIPMATGVYSVSGNAVVMEIRHATVWWARLKSSVATGRVQESPQAARYKR